MFAKSVRIIRAIFSLGVLVAAFAACSNIQQGKRMEDDEQTLRALTAERAELVPWTDELEGDRLTATITTADGIDRRVSLSPLSFIAGTDVQDVAPVYPFLDDFGSLDTTLIAHDVKDVLDGFCAALNHAENADSYMARGCLYQLALFYHDSNLVKPAEEPTDAPAENAENSDAGTEQVAFHFFDTFFYGQPYVTGDMYEIPVRFVGTERSMDVLVFLVKEGGTWKIDELQLLRAERADGK